jgi:phosphatidate cytidylyltransferase
MFASRALVTALLLPVGLALIVLGGTPFGLFVTLILALAGWEYWRLFRAGGLEPAGVLIPAGAAGHWAHAGWLSKRPVPA